VKQIGVSSVFLLEQKKSETKPSVFALTRQGIIGRIFETGTIGGLKAFFFEEPARFCHEICVGGVCVIELARMSQGRRLC
jgi:hypothetical protein